MNVDFEELGDAILGFCCSWKVDIELGICAVGAVESLVQITSSVVLLAELKLHTTGCPKAFGIAFVKSVNLVSITRYPLC